MRHLKPAVLLSLLVVVSCTTTASAKKKKREPMTPEKCAEMLKSDDAAQRAKAVRFMIRKHDAESPPLKELTAAMDDKSVDVRKAVYEAVTGPEWIAVPVAERLVEVAADPDRLDEVKHGLGRMPDNRDKTGDGKHKPLPCGAVLVAAIEKLEGEAQQVVAMGAVKAGAKIPDELGLKLQKSDPEKWDQWIGFWLEYCRSKDPKVIELIRAQLRAGDAGNGWHLAQLANGLGQIGPDAAAGVPELIAAMDDKRGHVRRYAARALPMIGKAAAKALPKIKDLAANDPDGRVKDWCAKAAKDLEAVIAGK